MKEILNHKWRCLKCQIWIGEDYDVCPICETKEIEKKRKQRFAEMRFYDKNKEKLRDKVYKWKIRNPEKVKFYYKNWYTKRGKEYREKNKERILQNSRNYYWKHREKVLENRRKYLLKVKSRGSRYEKFSTNSASNNYLRVNSYEPVRL